MAIHSTHTAMHTQAHTGTHTHAQQLTMIQDNELGTGLYIASIILSHTLVEAFVGFHQSKNLEIVLLLGVTRGK